MEESRGYQNGPLVEERPWPSGVERNGSCLTEEHLGGRICYKLLLSQTFQRKEHLKGEANTWVEHAIWVRGGGFAFTVFQSCEQFWCLVSDLKNLLVCFCRCFTFLSVQEKGIHLFIYLFKSCNLLNQRENHFSSYFLLETNVLAVHISFLHVFIEEDSQELPACQAC